MLLAVRAALSTFNPNFSKAETTIEVRIHRFNIHQCLLAPVQSKYQFLNELNSTIALPKIPKKKKEKKISEKSWFKKDYPFAISE